MLFSCNFATAFLTACILHAAIVLYSFGTPETRASVCRYSPDLEQDERSEAPPGHFFPKTHPKNLGGYLQPHEFEVCSIIEVICRDQHVGKGELQGCL